MNEVDASDHYEIATGGDTTTLSTVIIDTNPRAWAAMKDVLPLHKAVSSVLVFLNANLAFNNSNQVAVIASHTNRAVWLYPTRPEPSPNGSDVEMADVLDWDPNAKPDTESSANKYTQFAQIESTVHTSLKKLFDETTDADLESTTSQLSGALTLALAHINKTSLAIAASTHMGKAHPSASTTSSTATTPGLSSHILVLSVSDSEPLQYIPTMNTVFAAAHAQIPIDVLSLSPAAVHNSPSTDGSHPPTNSDLGATNSQTDSSSTSSFLQQATHITNGIFLSPTSPQGLLAYLTFGLACADSNARAALVPPTHHTVDFRAACFCHGRVVDTGFVCSVCLSIFCSVPTADSATSGDNTNSTPTGPAECLTCGTRLALGSYGARPAVLPRRRKKKKRILPNGSVREETGSAAGTPMR